MWAAGWTERCGDDGAGLDSGTRFVVEFAADGSADEGLEDAAEPASNGLNSGRLILAALVRRLDKLELLPTVPVGALEDVSPSFCAAFSSSSVTQRSHKSQPRKVAKLVQLTIDVGETRSWNMQVKQTMKMMTEQTCWRTTVESATNGQKSYGFSRGFRWRCSRNVAWSV